MTANNTNTLTIHDEQALDAEPTTAAAPHNAGDEEEATATQDDPPSLSAEEAAFAVPQVDPDIDTLAVRKVSTSNDADDADLYSVEIDEDAEDADSDDVDDPDAGGPFNPAPHVAKEFGVPLWRLCEWQHHPKRGSREKGDHFAALVLTAEDTSALRPIVVFEQDGAYPIVDGRFIWAAVKAAHPNNEDVEVRCVLFDGDEGQAVATVCDTALGTMQASPIEQAQALLSLKRTNNVSQTEIAKRYPRLTISKVSNMLIAARTREAYPALFNILVEPDRAPISYGVELAKCAKSMSVDAFQDVLYRADDLCAIGERVKATGAFAALQISAGADAGPLDAAEAAGDVAVNEEVFGHDDQVVGSSERLADGRRRLCMPTEPIVDAMSMIEREAAAEAFIAQIRHHFRLDR